MRACIFHRRETRTICRRTNCQRLLNSDKKSRHQTWSCHCENINGTSVVIVLRLNVFALRLRTMVLEMPDAVERSRIMPDAILSSIADFPEWLERAR